MRAPAVLLSIVMTGTISGFLGYHVATTVQQEEITHLKGERDEILARERELRSQLEEALLSRKALEQESQRLQTDLNERLRRLEELAAQLPHSGYGQPPPGENEAEQNNTPLSQGE